MKIWGRDPEYIVAKYLTKDGSERSSLLLASGWWGLARYRSSSASFLSTDESPCRHFHYIPEVLASVFWCVPAQLTFPLPYFYPFYLTILLTDRAWRDDLRCSDKYGEDWKRYCEKVPKKIIPGVV
jgi:7-dehydrocholesterol reductase